MSGMPDSSAGGSYDSLEEYIMATSRDHDEEIGKTIRLWEWQDRELFIIGVEINTNDVEIVNRAYSIGLQKLREDLGNDMEEVNKMVTEFLKATGEVHGDVGDDGELMSDVKDYEIDFGSSYGDLTEPKRFKLRKSEVSEVKDTYVSKGPFGGWLHRVITMLGLKESSNITSESKEIIDSVHASVNNKVEDSREYLERRIKLYFSSNIGRWAQEGVDDGTVEHIDNIVGYMETQHADELDAVLGILDNYGGD